VSHHVSALRASLTTFGIDTPQKAVERLPPPLITAIIAFAWFSPTDFADHWVKLTVGAIALLIVVALIYGWTLPAIKELARGPPPALDV
jgi:hypothetical protein